MNRWFLISLIALCAIIPLAIWIATRHPMNIQSDGENVSTSNPNDEIERFSQEMDRLRDRAESWDTWNIRLLFAAGLVASFLVVTAVGVSRSNRALIRSSESLDKAKDRKLQVELKLKDDAIAEARGSAATALKDAGNANARAEEAKKGAARVSLEAEKLKQTIAWRVLPPETASQLQKILSVKPGAVNLRYIDGDPESLYVAIQFNKILQNANWTVGAGSLKVPSLLFGILLPDADSADAKTLREALTDAKISFSTDKIPPGPVMSFAVETIPNAPMLLVGSKTPAVMQ